MIAGLAVLTNGVVLLVQTSLMKSPHDEDDASKIYVPWVSYFFVACKYSFLIANVNLDHPVSG